MKHNESGKYNYLSKAPFFGAASVIMVLISLAIIASKGFNYGIDFSGGTEIQIQFDKDVKTSEVRKLTKDLGYKNAMVQSFGETHEFLIRFPSEEGKTDKETNDILNLLIGKVTQGFKTTFAESGVNIRRVDSVGPQIGSELKQNGLLATFYALIMVLIYIGLRFDYKFAPGAVICLFHDAIITMGIYSLFQREVNVQTLAAVLTIIGYSLNDTIIVFDRIRENIKILSDLPFIDVVNRSLNDVLSRTILTSFTTMLAVGAMYFFAGGVIGEFAFTLGIGIIVGTYSSIYIASPLVLMADKIQNKF